MKVDIDEIKAGMQTLLSAQKDKENIFELGSTSSGIPQLPTQATLPQANQPVDPRLSDVDRGAKLEVCDFHGDHNPEVFLDWVCSSESFFRWCHLTDERKLFLADAKLKGTARIWWTTYNKPITPPLEHGKPCELLWLATCTGRLQTACSSSIHTVNKGTMSVEEYTTQSYSLATRSKLSWNEDIMISMYRQGLNPHLSCGLATSRLNSMIWLMLYRLPIKWRMKNPTPLPADIMSRSDRTFVDVQMQDLL